MKKIRNFLRMRMDDFEFLRDNNINEIIAAAKKGRE